MTTITALPARPVPDLGARTDRRLRTVGVAALVAAALGSVLGASPAMTGSPATDEPCRMELVGSGWSSSGCEEPAAR